MNRIVSWFSSVRGRITVAVTASFALVMVFGTWFLLDRAETAWIDDLNAQDLAELEMISQDLIAMEAFEAMLGDQLVLPVGEGGTVFAVTGESGELLAQSPIDVFGGVVIEGPLVVGETSDPVPGTVGSVSGLVTTGDITSVSVPVELSSGTLTLTASSSLEPVQAGVSALRGILLLTVPFLVGGVGAMTWFVTGRAFRPVADITTQVERITDDRLDQRVPVPESRDEVAHLAKTMNHMLARLAASRTRQRQFVSDASHELRNPIATSKTKLEVALAHPDNADWADTAQVVLEEQNRLTTLVNDMLMLARLDESQPVTHQPIDLDDIVLAEAARPSSLPIDTSQVGAARISGDANQLTVLVRNLIDNATRHAKGTVAISLTYQGEEAVLTVDDDGPGIDESDRSRVFERFVRLEDARTRDQGGAGLGLALAKAVSAAHHGSISVDEAPGGGARFEVRIPALPSDGQWTE